LSAFCEHLSSHHLIDDVHVFSAFRKHLSSHHLIDDVHAFSAFFKHLNSHHLIDDVHVFSAFCEHLSSHHLIDDVHVFSAFCEHLSSHLIDDVHVFVPFVSTWVHILLMMSMHSYLLLALEFTSSYWWCPCILTFCKHLSSNLIDDVLAFLPFVSTWVHIILLMMSIYFQPFVSTWVHILLMMSMYSYLLWALEFTSYWWCPCILTFCKHLSSHFIDDVLVFSVFCVVCFCIVCLLSLVANAISGL
jgi:hypothetical protein